MKQDCKVACTPENVESLKDGQVFVFGSNLIGYHSGGASLVAMQRFGAVWGQAEGPQGQCYAIPVDIRGEAIDNVSAYMKRHIDKFIEYAKAHGIALIKAEDYHFEFLSHSSGQKEDDNDESSSALSPSGHSYLRRGQTHADRLGI